MNIPARVKLFDLGNKGLGIDVAFFKMQDLGLDAQSFTALERAALVGKVVLACPHTHDCELRDNIGLLKGSHAAK